MLWEYFCLSRVDLEPIPLLPYIVAVSQLQSETKIKVLTRHHQWEHQDAMSQSHPQAPLPVTSWLQNCIGETIPSLFHI